MQRKGGYYQKRKGKPRRKGKQSIAQIKAGADNWLKTKVFPSIGIPEKKPFVPDPFQLEALDAIENADCLVTAPTGAGKTWIAEKAIERIVNKNGRAWYASPLKALTNSKFVEFSLAFGSENVGILTGDRKENPDAPIIVGTTEILRNQLYDAMHHGRDIATDFVILDEAHYLGDHDRGVVWEEIMIYLPKRVPLLLLSATIGNDDQLSAWLEDIRGRECIMIQEKKRPVPLFPLFFHPYGMIYPIFYQSVVDGVMKGKNRIHQKVYSFMRSDSPPILSRPNQLPPFADILRVLSKFNLTPVIFFLKSRADCNNALELCIDFPIKDEERKEAIKKRIAELTENIPHIAKYEQIWHLENLGVGSHHSGQLPAWKILVETLMAEGYLTAVFATSTVAAGVNFPARTVAFLNSDRFNGREFMPLNPTEFHQMTGRAGRRGMDKVGFALAIPGKFLNIKQVSELVFAPPQDVTSQLRINFSMVLNLLLSHTPIQIEELLEKSFAAYLMSKKKAEKKVLWKDFLHHLMFLKDHGYVDENDLLTDDGTWASQLRIDQPLIVAEGFRLGLFPDRDPVLLAAIVTAFVFEKDVEDRVDKRDLPKRLSDAFFKVKRGLEPFALDLMESGFNVRPMYLKPSITIYKWAMGVPWEIVVDESGMAEGDLAMLIMRTADNLRHIRSLGNYFKNAADSAHEAIELILREPVVTLF